MMYILPQYKKGRTFCNTYDSGRKNMQSSTPHDVLTGPLKYTSYATCIYLQLHNMGVTVTNIATLINDDTNITNKQTHAHTHIFSTKLT